MQRGFIVAAWGLVTMSGSDNPSPAVGSLAQLPRRPLVIGHRGASGYRPEHTIESYRLAIAQGADIIEPDLVMTRDGVLVARHENEIGVTTDAVVRFPDRKTTKTIDGEAVTGWFVEDFTLAEIKTLRAKERLPFRNHQYDGQFEVPTFQEILDFVASQTRETGRRIGIYPETKHPSYHQSLGLAITDSLIAALHQAGYKSPGDPIYIQSFEVGNLRDAHTKTKLKLIQLIEATGQPADFRSRGDQRTYRDMLTPAGLKEIRTYAYGIGPFKGLIRPISSAGELEAPTTLVADAHRAGLKVHIWTIRADREFLAAGYRGDPLAELRQFRELGVDGVFTDFPDLAVKAFAAGR